MGKQAPGNQQDNQQEREEATLELAEIRPFTAPYGRYRRNVGLNALFTGAWPVSPVTIRLLFEVRFELRFLSFRDMP
jgi:hypothetical protein